MNLYKYLTSHKQNKIPDKQAFIFLEPKRQLHVSSLVNQKSTDNSLSSSCTPFTAKKVNKCKNQLHVDATIMKNSSLCRATTHPFHLICMTIATSQFSNVAEFLIKSSILCYQVCFKACYYYCAH